MDNSEVDETHPEFQEALIRFEEYERGVLRHIDIEEILQCQNECLRMLEIMISYNYPEPYFTPLFHVRDQLLGHITEIEKEKEEVTLDEITIRRTFNPTQDSLLPSLYKILEPNFQPEAKKPKPSPPTENQRTDKLIDAIKNTLTVPQSTGLEELGGLKKVKNLLTVAIMFPTRYPHLFTEGRTRWNKALLYGPPGTGKTLLANSVAAEMKAPLYSVTNSDLFSSFVGESEKLVRTLFEEGQRNLTQCIIFIDEIDGICRVRNARDAEHERRFKTELLIQMSKMDKNPNNKIFFLACTNCPWDLDPAFIRRFESRIYVPLPNREERQEIFKLRVQSEEIMSSLKWNEILDKTEGWSGSDISNLVKHAMMQPIMELQETKQWIITDDHLFMPVSDGTRAICRMPLDKIPPDRVRARSVQTEDFEKAIKVINKTVTETSLKQFDKFINMYKNV